MKKLFSFVAAALMSASMFAGPAAVPTVQDVAAVGYDVEGKRVIVLYFDEQVCNDIVWAGSYNEWKTDSPADMLHFEPLEGFDGWYAVEVDDARTPQIDQTDDTGNKCCCGKPIQLKKDGSLSWDFQTGDADAWNDMAQPGTKQHYIYGGYSGEADICWNEYGVYIYDVAYFKMHNTPCVDKPVHNYTITAYLPEFCDEIADYADSVRVMGGFDGWNNDNYVWMELSFDEEGNPMYFVELQDVEEGTEFKLRFGTDAEWKVQVQLNGANLDNEKTGAEEAIVLAFNGEGYGFAACSEPVEYKYTEYENWQIKYGPEWAWTDNMTKVADGLYEIGIIWGNTGLNVKSDENPIKQDWYALDDPAVTIADGIEEGANVTVTLTVVDDETLTLNVAAAATGIAEVKAAIKNDGKYFINGTLYIKKGKKMVNVLGL